MSDSGWPVAHGERRGVIESWELSDEATDRQIDDAMREDNAVVELINRLEPYVKATPDYAGAYVTRSGPRARVHVGFTGDLKGHRVSLREGGLDDERLRLVGARFSLAELLAVIEHIRRRTDALRAEGIEVQSYGPDTVQNVVRVDVRTLTDHVRDRLRSEFGEAVQAHEATGQARAG